MMKKSQGFTLIELLIVVAIIAILAAIAVPNFLEAQTRAKVSRVQSDMRSIATALEAYIVDYNKYPWDHNHTVILTSFPPPGTRTPDGHGINFLSVLTTPVAFMSTVAIQDPFLSKNSDASSFRYYNTGYGDVLFDKNWGDQVALANAGDPTVTDVLPIAGYSLKSFGPDVASYGVSSPNGYDNGGEWVVLGKANTFNGTLGSDRLYDPTNGTISDGDIVRVSSSLSITD